MSNNEATIVSSDVQLFVLLQLLMITSFSFAIFSVLCLEVMINSRWSLLELINLIQKKINQCCFELLWQTSRQEQLQYTATTSLACSVIHKIHQNRGCLRSNFIRAFND